LIASFYNVNCKLFADDAVFYVTKDTFVEACSAISDFTVALSNWLLTNKLVAHTEKTKLILISASPVPRLTDVHFNGVVLEWVNDIKYLGIILETSYHLPSK
jgi:hypothetical protein